MTTNSPPVSPCVCRRTIRSPVRGFSMACPECAMSLARGCRLPGRAEPGKPGVAQPGQNAEAGQDERGCDKGREPKPGGQIVDREQRVMDQRGQQYAGREHP